MMRRTRRSGGAWRGAALLGLAALLGTACRGEDRPSSGDVAAGTSPSQAAPRDLDLSADSLAVVLGTDTLFTLDQLPGVGPAGRPLGLRALQSVAISPDSAYVAYVARGRTTVLGVWVRPRQAATVAAALEGAGRVAHMAWSPESRFLAFLTVRADSVALASVYDVRSGRTIRHPVLTWLTRHGRSSWPTGWIDGGRLRVAVSADRSVEDGDDYMWEMSGGSFLLESHLETFTSYAPENSTLETGGVFSIDLVGDPVPETIALYRDRNNTPSAILLEQRGEEFLAAATSPLVRAEILQLEGWDGLERGAALYQIVDLGGEPTILLRMPGPPSPLRTIGLFRVAPNRQVSILAVEFEGRRRPALFADGAGPGGAAKFGLVDLDGDGELEVVSATAQVAGSTVFPEVVWDAVVFRWTGSGLKHDPDLEQAAIAALQSEIASE